MMKKYYSLFFLTLCVESAITYFVAASFSVRFIEVMGIVGALISALLLFLTSSGGSFSNFFTAVNAAATGIIHKREEFNFKVGPLFLASMLYFVIGLIFFILLVTNVISPVE